MDRKFWAIIAVIFIIFGSIVVAKGTKSPSGGDGSSSSGTHHVEGNNSKGVTLVEYGDYECPYCGEYYSTVKQVVADYNDQIQFQFRNLPLTQIHPNAMAGARAAEAAGLQNKFWEMHDMLYENQNAWDSGTNAEPFFQQYAAQLGLNVKQFTSDFSSAKVNTLINEDITAFNKTGEETATPTFFLDGKKVSPNNTVAAFQSLINAEIAKKK